VYDDAFLFQVMRCAATFISTFSKRNYLLFIWSLLLDCLILCSISFTIYHSHCPLSFFLERSWLVSHLWEKAAGWSKSEAPW